MNDGAGGVDAFLDGVLDEIPSPSPDPTPSPVVGESPVPSPTPTPLAVQDDELIALVHQVHYEEQGTRVASSGSFIVQCLMLSLLIALVLFVALRRK